MSVKPFIKWAGGKRQLLPKISEYYPKDLIADGTITKYVEPFVGGGAVLFDILNKDNIKHVYIGDANPNLINTYTVIQLYVNRLIKELKNLEQEYLGLDDDRRAEYYLTIRNKFNNTTNILSKVGKAQIRHAAYFIFLNKTCFNGLYRVNKDGKFNVPHGKYKNPMICDEENLRAVSKKLENVIIKCCAYHEWEDIIDEHTFVYFDPPYRPLTKTASFNSYAKDAFGDNEQIALANFVKKIDEKGAMFVLSNSDPHNVNVNDNFFDDLYTNFNIHTISATRAINSNASGRGTVSELLITNIIP